MSTRDELTKEMKDDAEKTTFTPSGYKNIDLACLLEPPAKDYKALEEAAWNDFGKGEGLIEQAYLDQNGNPTIGNGTLIYPKKDINNPKQMAAWKKSYIESFPPEQKAQRAAQFDQIYLAQKKGTLRSKGGCPNIITSPATLKATEADMRYAFNVRFEKCYNRAKDKACPYIDIIPISSQLTIIHCVYAGAAPSLENDPKCKDPQSYPYIIRKVRDKRGPVCSHGERVTINDSIQVVNDSIPNANIPPAERRPKTPTKKSHRGR